MDAIRRAFPDGVVRLPADEDDDRLERVLERLRRELKKIAGVIVVCERPPRERPVIEPGFEGGDDPPSAPEELRSYHVLFVTFADPRLEYEAEDLRKTRGGGEERVGGVGRWGCSVGVSLVAPFATVVFQAIERYEDGTATEPDVHPCVFDLELRPLDMERHVRETMGDEVLGVLSRLRERIVRVLDRLGFGVPSDDILGHCPEGLRPGEDVCVHEPVAVRDALFFSVR